MIIESWERALAEGKHTVVMMDDNLDTSENSVHNKVFNLKYLYELWQKYLNKHNITQHNFKYTHFRPNKNPSCIDHVLSNCPNNINNVTTNTNSLSDHSIITANYSNKN